MGDIETSDVYPVVPPVGNFPTSRTRIHNNVMNLPSLLNFDENSISLEAFFSGHKTANEMFQGSPELLFGCKIKIYASEKHLVTK